MKTARDTTTGLYFDGVNFTSPRAGAKAIPAIPEALFLTFWPFAVEVIDTEAGPLVVPAAAPVLYNAPLPPATQLVLTNPKNGETLASELDDTGAIAALKVQTGGGDFALSILRAATSGRMSAAQRFWLHKLALGKAAAPRKAAVEVNLSALRQMFARAAEKLKRPALMLALPGTRAEVKVSLAGSRSKYAGQILVTSPHFNGPYYGRVDGAAFYPGKDSSPALVDLLTALAQDPQGTAQKHGHLTGKCCFCGRTLEDERSTAAGFGPTCAERFGLAWGSKLKQSA